mmetsp:Transcript_31119/g.119725  ORF Transcript_31119/g.119725 Transcript_31119/m.119725 type:complete len:222 (+) Transcript_31119:1802-2467(+)
MDSPKRREFLFAHFLQPLTVFKQLHATFGLEFLLLFGELPQEFFLNRPSCLHHVLFTHCDNAVYFFFCLAHCSSGVYVWYRLQDRFDCILFLLVVVVVNKADIVEAYSAAHFRLEGIRWWDIRRLYPPHKYPLHVFRSSTWLIVSHELRYGHPLLVIFVVLEILQSQLLSMQRRNNHPGTSSHGRNRNCGSDVRRGRKSLLRYSPSCLSRCLFLRSLSCAL